MSRKMITWESVEDEESKDLNGNRTENHVELPEEQQVQMIPKTDIIGTTLSGVRFQRCGGGRRIIRKHKEN